MSITATPDEPKPDASAPLALTGAVDASSAPVVPVASATTAPPSTTGPSCPDSDNMIGTPGNCGLLKAPGPQCESFADTKDECGHMAKGLKPRVAQRAVDCFLSKSGQKSVCDFQLPQNCAVEAIAEACIDPAVGPACDSILSNCTPHGRGRRSRSDLDARHLHARALGGDHAKPLERHELRRGVVQRRAVLLRSEVRCPRRTSPLPRTGRTSS